MPTQSRRQSKSARSDQLGPDWSSGDRGSSSNAQMQDRLRQAATTDVRANPLPWAPQNRSVKYQAQPGAQLFQDGAAATDVVQGRNGSRYLGDCWLLASLAGLAQTQPKVLEDAITDHGDGTYTVRLYRKDDSGSLSAEDVRVEGTLPTTADGSDAYAQREDPNEIWVVIIEKAFAAWKGGYAGLDAGLPSEALTALTGQEAKDTFTRNQTPASLGETFRGNADEGRAMVAASNPHLDLRSGGIIPGHAHTILGVQGTGDQAVVKLRDPYAEYEPSGNGARDGIFEMSMEDFIERFDYFSSSGAAQDSAR